MKRVLKSFSQEELTLLRLHLGEELSANEIAELLNKDVGVVRTDLNAVSAKLRYRARNILKKTREGS
jgi:DNA-directed RNA polymerase specialized sigma24 family protein